MPNWLSSEAMRMSACSAVSSPPPMQKPRIIAMTGLLRPVHAPASAAWPLSYWARASGDVRCSPNSEMSAPDANALSPAPVTTSTRTPGSASSAASTPGSAARISLESALRFAGLLKVTTAIMSVTSTSSLSVPVSRGAGEVIDVIRVPSSNHPGRAQLVNRLARVAQLIQYLVRLIADVGTRCPDAWRGIHYPDSVANDVQPAEHRVRHRLRHRQVLDLRVGENLIHPVDRPARHAGLVERADPLGRPPGRQPLADERVQLGAVRRPVGE